MKSNNTRIALGLVAATASVACAVHTRPLAPLAGSEGPPDRLAIDGQKALVHSILPVGAGAPHPPNRPRHVTLTIRWPDRQAQVIPAATEMILFEAFSEAGSPLASASVNRVLGVATASVTLPTSAEAVLPLGPVTLSVQALDGSGATVASATGSVTIVENQAEAVVLNLVPVPTPGPTPTSTPGPTPTPTQTPDPTPSPTPLSTPLTSTFKTVSGVALDTARGWLGYATLGGNVYAIGGSSGTVNYASVEKATLGPDGNLGNFSTLAGVTLDSARGVPATRVGNYVYMIAGYPGMSSVERAAIDGSNYLGSFQTFAAVSLPTALWDFGTAVVGNKLYVIGGGNGTWTSDIRQSAIDSSGDLGAFSTVGTLATGRYRHATVRLGNYLYVIGGDTGAPSTSVERAPIVGGSLGTFSTVGGVSLRQARVWFGATAIGNYLYVFGGGNGNGTTYNSVERAMFDSDPASSTYGDLTGSFSTVSGITLATPRQAFATTVSGNSVYIFGGHDGTKALSSVEKAVLPWQ